MSNLGWFIFGLFVGAVLFGLVLTYVESRWHWITGKRSTVRVVDSSKFYDGVRVKVGKDD